MPKDVLEELKGLISESRNPRTMNLDRMTTREILEAMNAEDRTVPDAVARAIPDIEKAVEIIVECFKQGGRLIYVGAGTSGRLGIVDASECPPTFGTEPYLVQGFIAGGRDAVFKAVEGAEDKFEQAAQDLEICTLNRSDVVVGISASRRTPYVLGALYHAKSKNSKTILLICNEPPPLTPPQAEGNEESDLPPAAGGTEGGSASDSLTFIRSQSERDLVSRTGGQGGVDVLISVPVGPEVLTGSTRLKAGTATKLVLNMITTAAMVRLGKCYENLMVDLRQGSQKLRARARRIFMELTDSDYDWADQMLKESAGELKTALIMHWKGLTPDHARDLLADNEGDIRKVLS